MRGGGDERESDDAVFSELGSAEGDRTRQQGVWLASVGAPYLIIQDLLYLINRILQQDTTELQT